MPTVTNDGRQFVYGVFGADGCECENLEAVFGSEKAAHKFIEKLRTGPMWKDRAGHEYAKGTEFYGRADLLVVKTLTVR